MNGLFRKQAIEHEKQKLYGSILLLPVLSHTLITSLLLIWFSFVIYWLFTSHYARKETVMGWLEPPAGIVRLYPENAGTIQKIFVSEGDYVKQGQALIVIKAETLLNSGENLTTQLLFEYETQRQLVNGQMDRLKSIYKEKHEDIIKKIAASKKEESMLENQLKTTETQYKLASIQAKRFKALNQDGHISKAEYGKVIQEELSLKSAQQNLLRNQITQKNLTEQLQTELMLLPKESANTQAQLQERLSDITQKMTQLKGQNEQVLKASRAGIVNNIQALEGQQISQLSKTPLLTLIPNDTQLTAHLLIPVRSAGFLERGQHLNIRYDAFPYQKFGLYKGRVDQISKTILLPNELLSVPISPEEPVYRITAHLMRADVQAYGKVFPLKPGMTLSADIRLGDRTLIQWLLEPLYSLNGRV